MKNHEISHFLHFLLFLALFATFSTFCTFGRFERGKLLSQMDIFKTERKGANKCTYPHLLCLFDFDPQKPNFSLGKSQDS